MSSYLVHSAKGTTWNDHKYKKIENGRYIYDNSNGTNTQTESEEDVNNINLKDVSKKNVFDVHIDKNKWGKSSRKSSKSSKSQSQNPDEHLEAQSEEEKLAAERAKLENEVAIKNLKEQLEPEKTEEEIAAEEAAKEKVKNAQNYIASFNATYKNTPTSKIPKERLLKYRENMSVIMSNSNKEQK